MKFRELSVNAKAAMIAGAVVVVAGAVALAVGATGKQPPAEPSVPEATATAEATLSVESTRSAESTAVGSASTASVEATRTPSGPSYTKFGYIRAVDGTSGKYTLSVDFFVLLAGDEAVQYAAAHGLTVQDNGLLFDNPDQKITRLPLSKDASIRFATGGVEALSLVPTDADRLKAWADGNADVMPGAMTDRWTIEVDEGVVTRIDMLVVAD